MNNYFQTVNAFIEDTCVIIVLAYLLARGRMLALLFQQSMTRTRTLYLGVIFGLIGLTEVVFPGARYPYVTNTLIVTFAALTVGLQPALLATLLIALSSMFFQGLPGVGRTLAIDCLSAAVGAGMARAVPRRAGPLSAFLAGICAQTVAVVLLLALSRSCHTPFSLIHSLISIPANGLAMLLLLLVVNDARIRHESEKHRTEAERSHALVAEAQVRELRARIHPHFLFNALTSIAALCGIAPDNAERAVLRLSQLMRRSLESNLTEPLCLSAEMEYVDGYLEIEQHRFGARLHVERAIDPSCSTVLVPAFAVQTLVENAVNHGVGPKIGQAHICVVARRSQTRVLVAVIDDGVGIDTLAREQAAKLDPREHGLQILSSQLLLLYGRSARVRLFRREAGGTLAAFVIPVVGRGAVTRGNT